MVRTFGLVLAIILLLGASIATGAAQATELADAGIVFGDCTTAEFEFALVVPETRPGQAIGSNTAVPGEQSFTTLPVTLDGLTSEESAVVLLDESDRVVACGPIGGVPGADGSLVVGIAPLADSGVLGVAYLVPSESDVIVLLLTIDLNAKAQPPTSPSDREPVTIPASPPALFDARSGALSPEEATYANGFTLVMDTMATSRADTERLLEDARPDEEEWNFNLIIEVVTWQDLDDRVNELTPPSAFAAVHQVTVQAFALYAEAGDELLEGIEHNDSALLQSAFAKIDLADNLRSEANERFNKVIDGQAP